MSTSAFDKGPSGRVFEADTAAETALAVKNRTSNTNTFTITGAGDLDVRGGDIWNTTSGSGLIMHGTVAAGSDVAEVAVVSTNTRTAGTLFSVANSGTEEFTVEYDGTGVFTGDVKVLGGDIKQTTSLIGLTAHGNVNAGSDVAEFAVVSTATRSAGRLFSVCNTGTEKFQINYVGLPGFFGGTAPTARTALIQTYATTDTTLAAWTSDSENTPYTGIASTTAGSYLASVTDLNALRTAYVDTTNHVEDLAQFVNSLVDALQATGLIATS